MKRLATIILTYNEELHIERCIRSAKYISDRVIVVDSLSSDSTQEIAESNGAEVVKHEFVNQARQLNWALEELKIEEEWVLRLDADEILSKELVKEIETILDSSPMGVNGYMVGSFHNTSSGCGEMARPGVRINGWMSIWCYEMVVLNTFEREN